MKKTLTLGSIVLGCCLFALAQTSSYYQFQSDPSSSAEPPAMSANQSAKQKTTVQGCLSHSADGIFTLSDASGNIYQLNDGSSRLAQFVGKEVRVDGFGLSYSNGDAVPGAMSASPTPAQQIDVTRVRKIAEKCQTRSGIK